MLHTTFLEQDKIMRDSIQGKNPRALRLNLEISENSDVKLELKSRIQAVCVLPMQQKNENYRLQVQSCYLSDVHVLHG